MFIRNTGKIGLVLLFLGLLCSVAILFLDYKYMEVLNNIGCTLIAIGVILFGIEIFKD